MSVDRLPYIVYPGLSGADDQYHLLPVCGQVLTQGLSTYIPQDELYFTATRLMPACCAFGDVRITSHRIHTNDPFHFASVTFLSLNKQLHTTLNILQGFDRREQNPTTYISFDTTDTTVLAPGDIRTAFNILTDSEFLAMPSEVPLNYQVNDMPDDTVSQLTQQYRIAAEQLFAQNPTRSAYLLSGLSIGMPEVSWLLSTVFFPKFLSSYSKNV